MRYDKKITTPVVVFVFFTVFTIFAGSNISTRTPKAVLIMLDGVRADAFMSINTPHINALANGSWQPGYNGCYSLNAKTVHDAPANSAPNHTAIATGVSSTKNLVFSNGQTINGNYDKWPHAFSYIEAKNPEIKTAFVFGWAESGQIRAKGDDVLYLEAGDNEVAEVAKKLINNNTDALMIYINAPDGGGHNHGFYPHTSNYNDCIEKCDRIIKEILETISDRPEFASEDWMIIVTSDHGGYHSGHGMASAHATSIPLIIAGKSVKNGRISGTPQQMDSTATLLKHFGVSAKKLELDGKVLGQEIFTPPAKHLRDNLLFIGDFENTPLPAAIENSENFTFPDNQFTAIMWIKDSGNQNGDAPVFSNKAWNNGTNPGIVIASNTPNGGTGNGYVCNVKLDNEQKRVDIGAFDTLKDEWLFLAVTFDGNNTCFFVEGRPDGHLYFISENISNAVINSGMPFMFAQDGTGEYKFPWEGIVGEAAIWNRGMSINELQKIFKSKRNHVSLKELIK